MSKTKLLLDLAGSLRNAADTLQEIVSCIEANDNADAVGQAGSQPQRTTVSTANTSPASTNTLALQPNERIDPETGEIIRLDLPTLRAEAAAKGKTWPGYKLVAGMTKRKYTSEADVIRACTDAGYTNIYRTTLLGISDLEKAIGKKAFKDVVSPFVFKPEGKPELVPLSDRRKPLSSAEADFAE